MSTNRPRVDNPLMFIAVITTIVFVILKLTGVIPWDWLWVLAPLWIVVAFGIAVWIILAIAALVVFIVRAIRKTNRKKAAKK